MAFVAAVLCLLVSGQAAGKLIKNRSKSTDAHADVEYDADGTEDTHFIFIDDCHQATGVGGCG